MTRDPRSQATAVRSAWIGLLFSVAALGGLAAAGWLLGRWFSAPQPPLAPAPVGAASDRRDFQSDDAAPPAAVTPENVQIARLREEALGILIELEGRFPQEPGVLTSVGSLYALYGLDSEAQQRWERALKLAPHSAPAYNAVGCSALIRGDYDQAIQMLSKAAELDARLPRARLMLGEALTNVGRLEQAVEQLERFVAKQPDSAEGHYRLGQAYLHLQRYEQARRAHQRAIELAPQLAAAYHALATTSAALGEAEQADEYRRKFTELNRTASTGENTERGGVNDVDLGRENLAEAHLVAARTYTAAAERFRRADYADAAERHLLAAVRADPRNCEARYKLLDVHDKSKRFREGAEILAELQQLEPEEVGHHINRGILLVRLKEYGAAEQEFHRAMALAPEEADGYAKLAWLRLLSRLELREARKLAETAIRLQPEEAQHHLLMSQVCEALDDLSSARVAIERAIELEPNNRRFRQAKATLHAPRTP